MSSRVVVIRNVVTWLLTRLVVTILVIFLGLTLLFVVTRITPRDPASELIGRITGFGGALSGEELIKMRETVLKLYGLNKPILNQYFDFITGVLTWNFGPSFAFFPTPVQAIISRNIWWTVVLLVLTIVLSWIIGVILGTLSAFFENKKISKALLMVSTIIYPLPYIVLALVLFIVFSIVVPVYSGVGGAGFMKPELSWEFLKAAISRAWLPALTLIIIWVATWFVGAYMLTLSVKREDYVFYATIRALPRDKLISRYVLKNVALPQITALTLSLGNVFSGALATEYLFTYPGLGYLILLSLQRADFNLLLGICAYSITGVAVAAFILDIIYPFIDPRIRYGFRGE
ncbi:MAG: ABC transporter permease [Desulfurococcaceae archaeon]